VKNVSRFAIIQLQNGFPMRASDSSVGGAAGQFHTARSAAAMVFAGGPSKYVSRSLCDALVAGFPCDEADNNAQAHHEILAMIEAIGV
jgi:hypothetical protein